MNSCSPGWLLRDIRFAIIISKICFEWNGGVKEERGVRNKCTHLKQCYQIVTDSPFGRCIVFRSLLGLFEQYKWVII